MTNQSKPTDAPPEQKYDALLTHTAERLASFLGLRYEDADKVADGLKLTREELAIWTMHDLLRAPSAPAGQGEAGRHYFSPGSKGERCGVYVGKISPEDSGICDLPPSDCVHIAARAATPSSPALLPMGTHQLLVLLQETQYRIRQHHTDGDYGCSICTKPSNILERLETAEKSIRASSPAPDKGEVARQGIDRRWNLDQRDDGIYFCRGTHHRSHDCEWERLTIDIIQSSQEDAP